MKKVFVFVFLTLVVSVFLFPTSFAETYSYKDIVDIIDTAIEDEGIDTVRRNEGNFSQDLTGIIITWDKARSEIYFDYANNDLDKVCSWQFSKLTPIVKIMKSIGSLWYDLIDFEKDGCMILYNINAIGTIKSYIYAPYMNLGDMISDNNEQFDSVESFIDNIVDLVNTKYGINETPIQDYFQTGSIGKKPTTQQSLNKEEDGHQYIMDQGNVQIYINEQTRFGKKDEYAPGRYIIIPIVVINNSNSIISVKLDNVSMNGWKTYGECNIFSVPAGKKAKGQLAFNVEDAEVKKLEDFTDAEFVFDIYDSNTYHTIFKSPIISIAAEDYQ